MYKCLFVKKEALFGAYVRLPHAPLDCEVLGKVSGVGTSLDAYGSNISGGIPNSSALNISFIKFYLIIYIDSFDTKLNNIRG